MKVILIAICSMAALHVLPLHLKAQSEVAVNDHLFIAKGRSTLSIATGVPFVVAAEYAHGFSKRFSAGLLFGKIPIPGAQGFGVRLRGILASNNNGIRVYCEMPAVVYPETRKKARKPWYLVYPSIMTEKKFNSGVRLSGGAGLLVGGCLAPVVEEHDLSSHEHQVMVAEKKCVFGGDGGRMAGLWYSINSGIALPISKRVMFQQSINAIAGGIKSGTITKKDWLYQPSVVIITGLTFSL